MTFTLKIETGNAAFEENSGQEIARILRELASHIDERDVLPNEGSALFDYNGNRVGRWDYE